MSSKKQPWQGVSQNYRASIAAKIPEPLRLHASFVQPISPSSPQSVIEIPRICGLLTQKEIDITENYEAVSLLEKIAKRELSSYAVTTAFCKRAAISQQLINCLTDILFDEALARASYCDGYLAREGKTLGPFHGLPISLKDSFDITGLRSTIGYVDFLKREPASENSALAQILLSQGAVLYVKTNVPQTLMAADTHNNLFGRTLNPGRLCLTVGGSSGGEAALLAMRGSIMGVGTDIAGGIRIPSLCCGITGFKPSSRRIPFSGQTIPRRRGGFGIQASVGPLCRSIRDMEYFMRSILQFDGWTLDEDVLSVPWLRRPISQTQMPEMKTFGVILEDPKYPLHPSVLRNLSAALQKISAAGHKLIQLENELPKDIVSSVALTAMTVLGMDPDKTAVGYVARGGEPLVPSISTATLPELAKMKPNINGVFNLNTDINNFRSMFRQVIVDKNLDGILMPAYQSTAVPHDTLGVPSYTVLANLLDYPACVIPYGRAEKVADATFVRDVPYVPSLTPDAIEGAPCAIQIIGRNMKDEELLFNAQIIESILKG